MIKQIIITSLTATILSTSLQAQYLPLSGGTMTGSLSMSSGTQIQSSYYGFNAAFTQPSTSANVAIFTNNNTTTMDFVGWNNGWRFIPVSGSSYPSSVVTFSPTGNAVFGNTVSGLPAGGSALTLRGPNVPVGAFNYQDINYSFNGAGSARIRAYRGNSWDTYLQFLVNKVGQGSDAPTVAMHIDQTGNVGIGTSTPGAPLEIYRNGTNDPIARFGSLGANDNQSLSVYNGSTSTKIFASGGPNTFVSGTVAGDGGLMVGSSGNMFFGQGGTPVMVIKAGGNVLIGKTTQANAGYILDINGNTRANKVVVNTTGADFVFDSSYDLQPLSTVESYIQQNKHLPDIEPADQMQKEGVDLGSNQTKLLQKIEELTLYMIEQNKKISEQNQQLTEQSKKIEALQAEMKQIRKTK